ncbi:acetylserotonin O-methyltransferase [bacterium]|nr:acetylserotonin O-methyltransferase [bacterium]
MTGNHTPPLIEMEALTHGFWRSRIMFAGVELGIFDALARKPMTEEELTAELGYNRRAVGILLGALGGVGLLEVDDNRYRVADRWAEILVSGGAMSQTHLIMHMRQMWDSWGRLDDVVRTGRRRQLPPLNATDEEARVRAFIGGMHEGSRPSARELAARLDLSGVNRMLDVGGGPGTYCIELARRRPELHATLLDRILPLEVARENIEAADLEDRIERRLGDALTDDYGENYDLVLISQLLHAYGPQENANIIRKAAEALRPGGRLIVNEFALLRGRHAPACAAVFGVNMLVNTDEGQTYTADEITGWMRDAGLVDLGFEDLVCRSTIFHGTRPVG